MLKKKKKMYLLFTLDVKQLPLHNSVIIFSNYIKMGIVVQYKVESCITCHNGGVVP